MNKREIISYIERNDLDSYRIEIIEKLLSEDLNPTIIKSIYNSLTKDHAVIKTFMKLLKNKNNIHDIGIEQIEKILYLHDVSKTDKAIKVMLNKKLRLESLISRTLKDVKFFAFSSVLDEEIYNDLYDVKWSGIGRGEVLLCMLIKNAISNTYKRGDILVNNKIIEVKSDNSKLINQSDFGNGSDVSDYWIKTIKNHPMIEKSDLLRGHNNNRKWNMSRGNNFLNYYVDLLLKKGVEIKEVADLICSGWDKLFFNSKMKRAPIRKILKSHGTINGEAFKLYTFEVFLHNMVYYLEQSNIDYIALTSIDGFYLLDKDFFKQNKDKLREFSKNHFLYKYPSLTKTASNSRVFSISLLEG
jgi:hypothetical protein